MFDTLNVVFDVTNDSSEAVVAVLVAAGGQVRKSRLNKNLNQRREGDVLFLL